MKQILASILALALLLCLIGCRKEPQQAGIPFYYCAAQPSYSTGSTAISPEYRRGVPQDSLFLALEVYLGGPASEELRSPFPEGLTLAAATQQGSTVYLTLSRELADLTDLELTIACGCLSLTAMALTQAERVEISAVSGLLNGQRSIVMDKNTLLLQDVAGEGESR